MGRRGMGFHHFPAVLSEEDARPVDRRTVRRVVGTFRPYRRKVALVGLAIVVTSVLGIVNPLMIERVFDRALFCGPGCPDLDLLYLYV
ncbi:MAG: hypothetical protein HY658_01165, partial [Actinobacteria bacterium]|nr:hypothetical protein [Actinomycetota bacterium]